MIIALLIIIIALYFTFCFTYKEKFQNKNYIQDLQNQRFQSFNQNYNADWKGYNDANKFPIKIDFPNSYGTYKFLNLYRFFDFLNLDIEKIMRDAKFSKLKVGFFKGIKEDLSDREVGEMNNITWVNRVSEYNPDKYLYFDYIKSPIKDVNLLNNTFLKRFNNYASLEYNKKSKTNIQVFDPYFIYKHRLINKWNNYYGSVVVLMRNNGFIAYSFYLVGLFENNNLKNIWVEYIGNDDMAKFLEYGGLESDDTYQISPQYCRREQDKWIQPAQYKKEAQKIKEKRNKNAPTYKYICYTYDKGIKKPYSQPLYAVNKTDCLSRYSIGNGKPKPAGIWDTKCVKDEDCPFYELNKNYKNKWGGCKNGTCVLPVNMQNLGHHFFIPETQYKPMCYNCDSTKWEHKTNLGFCCDEQKDRKKYPFLNSPDYAFEGDRLQRYNYYIKNNCVAEPQYNNIFNNKSRYLVKCKDGSKFYTF